MALGGKTLQEPAYTSLIRICGARGDTVRAGMAGNSGLIEEVYLLKISMERVAIRVTNASGCSFRIVLFLILVTLFASFCPLIFYTSVHAAPPCMNQRPKAFACWKNFAPPAPCSASALSCLCSRLPPARATLPAPSQFMTTCDLRTSLCVCANTIILG